jgi:hypothetical protein
MGNQLSIHSPSIKYGLIGGFTYIALMTVLYVISLEVFVGYYRAIPYIAGIGFAIYAGIEEKRINGGYLAFQNALLTIFLAILIVEVIWSFYMLLLYNFIDPTLDQKVREVTVEKARQMFENLNMSDSQTDEVLSNLENASFKFNMQTILLSLLTYSVIGFVIALIAAAIIKKQPEKSEE